MQIKMMDTPLFQVAQLLLKEPNKISVKIWIIFIDVDRLQASIGIMELPSYCLLQW